MSKGGLSLGKTLVADQKAAPTRQSWSTYDEAAQAVYDTGFDPPSTANKPSGDYPKITDADLTNPDSKEYASTFRRVVAWFEYASETMAYFKALELELEESMNQLALDIKMGERLKVRGEKEKGLSVDAMKTLYESDKTYRTYKREAQRIQQQIMILKPRLDGLETSYKLMSRNLELLRLDAEGAGRAENLHYRQKQEQAQTPGNRWRKQ